MRRPRQVNFKENETKDLKNFAGELGKDSSVILLKIQNTLLAGQQVQKS
jgi:hypothetical protein